MVNRTKVPLTVLGVFVLVLSMTACTSGKTAEQTPQTTAPTTTNQGTTTPTTTTSTVLPAPCELLTLADAKSILGESAAKSDLGGRTRCEYETPAFANVSVGIDYYDATVPLYGETVTGLDADQALWAASSSQLIVVKGDKILTFFAISSGEQTALEMTKAAARLALAKF